MEAIFCVFLLLAGLGCSWLALLFTGGDSAFANESGWVYAPLLAGLGFTGVAVVATALRSTRLSAASIATSGFAYVATLVYWFEVL